MILKLISILLPKLKEVAENAYLCKYSGRDSVDNCRDSPDWWDGTESSLELDVLLSKPDLRAAAKLLVLLCVLPMKELTDSEYFSPNPFIWRVSAV